ncbi:MAG: glycoside hydrolase family 3 protein, partial [Gemmataceae bacterium]|nr:glycoside hydrolase family 3 protein [Gemmataceae bacterium]
MQAQLGERRRVRAARSGGGPSPALVIGIVLLAASLVAVGTAVALSSVGLAPPGLLAASETLATRPPAATPTAPPTPAVFTVGRQGDPTPTATAASGQGAVVPATQPSLLLPPAGSGSGPIVNPQPPSGQPSGGSTPAAPPAGSEPSSQAGGAAPGAASSPAPAVAADPVVDAAFARLTTDEDLVGQLLLLAWVGSRAEDARPALERLRAGGMVFVQNTTLRAEATAINQGLRQIARDVDLVPPLLAIDHEGGNVQRVQDVDNVGSNAAFGRRSPSDLEACQRGEAHARTLREMGFTVNLAPVLDVNNNPNNPVIGPRSYSADPQVVARLGAQYIRGLQGGGVAAIGKHFPGHGNTSVDSHVGLPSLPQTVEELNRVELVPFRAAIDAGVGGIMSAHIVFPAVDPT